MTAHQVRSKVAWVLQKEPDALVIGLHAAGPWQGDGELDLGERRFAVVRADTVLEVREALADAEALARPTVVLTGLEQGELGHDVVARLARGKLCPVDIWEGVKALFKARQLDPSLRDRCLAEALLAHRPPGGEYPPVPAGVLDAATAWRAIFHHALGMEDREPDLPGLLRWAARRPGRAATSRRRPNSATPRGRAWPRRWGRRPGRSSTSSRRARPATRSALAVACEVVFAEGADEPALQAAAARLERFHRNRPIPPDVGRLLARAGRDAIDDLDRDEPEQAQGHLLRADALLREVQAAPLRPPRPADAPGLGGAAPPVRPGAGRRDRPRGRGRPGRLPRTRRSASPTMRTARQPALRAPVSSGRGWRCGWPAGSAPPRRTRARSPSSPAATATRSRSSTGPATRWPAATTCAELSDAYARLGAGRGRPPGRVQPGVRARPWPTGPRSGSDPGAVLRVEDVAGPGRRPASSTPKVARPAGRARRDELAGRPRAAGRPAAAPLGRGGPARGPAGRRPRSIAAIPSVTEFSRTSLLAGLAAPGQAGRRAAAVPGQPRAPGPVRAELSRRSCSTRASSPRGAAGRWPGRSRRRSSTAQNRVVAVVINAVDDRLAGASAGPRHLDGRGDPPARRPAPSGPRVGPGRGPGQRPRPRLAPRPAPPRPPPDAVGPLAARRRPGPRRRGPAGGRRACAAPATRTG